jgi:hypothetical protein
MLYHSFEYTTNMIMSLKMAVFYFIAIEPENVQSNNSEEWEDKLDSEDKCDGSCTVVVPKVMKCWHG